jgi:uncharacterized damage-inducible protein DinB
MKQTNCGVFRLLREKFFVLITFSQMSASSSSSSEADLRYPVGRFQPPTEVTGASRAALIQEIEEFPGLLEETVAGLNDEQLDTPYRPGGWTVRQVVHHLADSHLNSYQRYRLALTEDAPLISAYKEAAWAELPDAKKLPVDISLALIASLHARWVFLVRSLTDEQFARTFKHPERGEARLDNTLALYAWHGRHHAAHIRSLRDRKGW